MKAAQEHWAADPLYSKDIIGVRQHTMLKDVAAFAVAEIVRPAPLPKLLALLTNHETIYLFNYELSSGQQAGKAEWSVMDACRLKLDLRMTYKFQSFLHLKPSYSTNCECLLLMVQGGEIAVFNEQIYLLGIVRLQCCNPVNKLKHSLDYLYLEKESWRESRKIKRGHFLFLFGDSIEWHEVEIDTNHKLSQFKPSYRFSMTQITKKLIETQIHHPLGLELLNYKTKLQSASEKANDFIYVVCNCSTDVFFYLISKDTMEMEERVCLKGVGEGPSGVTSVAVGVVNQRAILGLSTGIVKVYSLKQQNRGKILFSIEVSHSPIKKMLWLKQKQILLAYSHDCTLNEISFNTMAVEQSYKAGCYQQMTFINQRSLIGLGFKSNNSYNLQESTHDWPNRQLILAQLSLNSQQVVELNSRIAGAFRFGNEHLMHLQDNSMVFLRERQEAIDVVKTYLPPKCIAIRSVSRNIFETDREQYWLLTDKSQVYKYQYSGSEVKVGGVLEMVRFIDTHGTQHKFKINFLIFAKKTVPLSYDSEVTERQYPPNRSTQKEAQPLFLATTSGDLLMVSLKQPNMIIFRIKKIDAPLLYIHEISPYFDSDPCRSVVVFGSEKKCFFLEVTAHRFPNELFRVELASERLRMINDHLLALSSGPHFNIYYFKEDLNSSEPQCYKEEHYSPGLVGDSRLSSLCYSDGNYITSGYTLGQIIVWKVITKVNQDGYLTLHPFYVFENSKEEPITYAFFIMKSICFNLGRYFIRKQLQKRIEDGQERVQNRNKRISKAKDLLQEETQPRQIKRDISMKQDKRKKQLLPSLKKRTKIRSQSLGLLHRTNELSEIFHFPDTQLYRSFIHRSFIH